MSPTEARFAVNSQARRRLKKQSGILKYLLLIAICASLLLAFKPELSRGVYVNMLSRGPDPNPGLTDMDGLYLMTIESKHMVRLRSENIRFEDLASRLQSIFRTRSERLLLVKVDGDIEVGDVIEILDTARSRVPLKFGLLTKNSTPTAAEPSLFMNRQFIYTQYFFAPLRKIPLKPRIVRNP
jgi:biopolymer transport protein ExbD